MTVQERHEINSHYRADELKVDVNMPNQIRWGFGGRGGRSATSALDVPELIGSA